LLNILLDDKIANEIERNGGERMRLDEMVQKGIVKADRICKKVDDFLSEHVNAIYGSISIAVLGAAVALIAYGSRFKEIRVDRDDTVYTNALVTCVTRESDFQRFKVMHDGKEIECYDMNMLGLTTPGGKYVDLPEGVAVMATLIKRVEHHVFQKKDDASHSFTNSYRPRWYYIEPKQQPK